MKKLLSMILCFSMIFSLCACAKLEAIRNTELPPLPTREQAEDPAGDPAEEPAPAAEAVAETAAVSDPGQSEGPGDAAQSVEAEGAELGDRVTIYMKKTQEAFDAPDGSLIFLFSYVTPTVRIDERPQTAETINEQLRLLDELYISGTDGEGGKNQLLEDALDNYTYVRATGAELNTLYSSARTAKSVRADGSVISFRYWTSVYTGGMSGKHGYLGLSFDGQTGEKLTLDALSSDQAAFRKALVDNLIAQAKEDRELYSRISHNEVDADTAIASVVREGNWYFSEEGIVIFPAFGELKPESEGLPMFTVPYSALVGVMDARFLPAKRDGDASIEIVRLDEMEDGTIQSVDRLAVSEDGEELYLKISGTAFDVTVCGIYIIDQPEDGERFHEGERYWYSSYMSDCGLQLCAAVPHGLPDLMISYTDADYIPHRYFLSESGAGGIALVDDSIEAVG